MSTDNSASNGDGVHGKLHRAREVLLDELRRFMLVFFYIWVLLSMFTVHEELALRTHGGIPFAPHGIALINALVLGKVALVVVDLRLGQRVKKAPLIYPILIEAFILAVLFIGMHVLEDLVAGWLHGDTLAASIPAIGGGGLVGLFFAACSFFVAMIPFSGFIQLTHAIGWPRMRGLLFGESA